MRASIPSTQPNELDETVGEPAARGSALLYGAVIFLSATLLFLVQPIIAKKLLPRFGGAAAVWGACMVYFQATLLLGYLYAHFLIRKLGSRAQAIVHFGFLALSVVATVLPASGGTSPAAVTNPVWETMKALTSGIGLPYFLLSSTTPLLQGWYSRGGQRGLTYRFFALSNCGSVLALLAFPFLIEPSLDLATQLATWRGGYIAFALLCGAVCLSHLTPRSRGSVAADPQPGSTVGWSQRLTWVALAGCSSALLLGVTNSLCQNIAPIPLLWIAPLAIYLISFVICFDCERSFPLPLFRVILPAALVALIAVGGNPSLPIRVAIPVCLASLFVTFLFCHGQLAALKPGSRDSTAFYVCVSVGGALGGTFVGLVAPVLFTDFFEVQLSVALCLALGLRFVFGYRSRPFLVIASSACAVFLWFFGELSAGTSTTYSARSFYGVLSVREQRDKMGATLREVLHGKVVHGGQVMSGSGRREPKHYYGRDSGIGLVLQRPVTGRRVGVVGLGAGTLAVYGRPGDMYRFYEINPLMIDLAKSHFTYIQDSEATVEMVLGDARLSLEQEDSNQFDTLVLDAFSGDSIPVHLLTLEAFRGYLRHMKQNGVLAVHISNQFLDLRPVVTEIATVLGQGALLVQSEPEPDGSTLRAAWILVSADLTLLQTIGAQKRGEHLRSTKRQLWTDQYSNILGVLR